MSSTSNAVAGEVSTKSSVEGAREEHTRAIDMGGMTMMQLTAAMKRDAKNQERLLHIIWDLVSETVERNDARKRTSQLKMFEGEPAPIPALAYLSRIKKYGGCSECCFVVALIYLERIKLTVPSVCLTSNSFQRLLLIAVMCASKFLDDFYYSNKHWADIGGISLKEVNGLELEFLFRLAFSCSIQREEYDLMAKQLLAYENPSHALVAKSESSQKDESGSAHRAASGAGSTAENKGTSGGASGSARATSSEKGSEGSGHAPNQKQAPGGSKDVEMAGVDQINNDTDRMAIDAY